MASVRLISATKPHLGEEWRLKRARNGLVLLDEDDEVVTQIPGGESGLRILFPGFWASRKYIVVVCETGNELLFEPKPKTLTKLREMLEECAADDPAAAAAAYRKCAIRDLLIGAASFLIGVVITCVSFYYASPDGRFAVMTGFIVAGLIEIGRGIYFAIKAAQLGSRVAELDDDDDLEEDDDEE